MAYRVVQYPTKVEPIVTLSQPETTTPDKWQPDTEVPLFRAPRVTSFTATFFPPDAPSPPAVYISGMPPGPIAVQSFQYDDIARPVPPIVAAEAITLDKWFKETERPIFKPARLIQYGVNTAIASERLYPDALQFTSPLIPRAPRRTALYGPQSDPKLFQVVGETITLDKWHKAPERPRLSAQSVVHLLPAASLQRPITPAALPTLPNMENALPIWKQGNRAVYIAYGFVFLVTPAGTTIIPQERANFRLIFSGLFGRVN